MLTIVGTIAIDGGRWHAFHHSLRSLEPVADLLTDWRLNIAGDRREEAAMAIDARWPDNTVGTDNNVMSIYDLLTIQLSDLGDRDLIFFWQEDHWFLCPHPVLFRLVLADFALSRASVLNVSHLHTSWNRKLKCLPVVGESNLRKTFAVNEATQARLWEYQPLASLTGIPAVYKVAFFRQIMDHQRAEMEKCTNPAPCELRPDAARAFLRGGREYLEMVPSFHVFREVFPGGLETRSTNVQDALDWLELRDGVEFYGGSWEHGDIPA